MARRYYSSTFTSTTLTSGVGTADTTLSVDAVAGAPGSVPWTAVVDEGTSSEELVHVTNVSGTALTVTRGIDGTTAKAHSVGASFEHVVSARDFDEANAHVNTAHADATSLVSKAGGDTITASAATVIPLVVKGAASQTANLLEARDSAGTVLAGFSPIGRLLYDSSLVSGSAVAGTSGGLPSQVAGYLTIQNANGTAYKVPFYNA